MCHFAPVLLDKPKLRAALKKLLPLATNWKTIGVLLGISTHVLDKIKDDEVSVSDCLHAMLSEWLKQTHPPPTWAALADAVQVIDPSMAHHIRSKLVGIHTITL